MGAGQSTAQAANPSRALHVLRVTPSSPASQTNIEPFFDFIVGFENGSSSQDINSSIDAAQLEKIVESHEEQTLNLLVWSSKNKNTRVVPIVPSKKWSQSSNGSDVSAKPSLLGLSMRMCEPEFALENVWHVLDVLEGSPAESAGLVPYGDYIIGWSGGALNAENDFYDLVEAHVEKPLRVYVYSHDFDALREVVLVPNRHWGGDGLLGCVFGYGLLHRIPARATEGVSTPPDFREDTADDYEEQDLFVPADTRFLEPINYRDTQGDGELPARFSSTPSPRDIPSLTGPSMDTALRRNDYNDPPADLFRSSTDQSNSRRTPNLIRSGLVNGSPGSSTPNLLQRQFSSSTEIPARPDGDDDDAQDEQSVADTDGGSLTSVD